MDPLDCKAGAQPVEEPPPGYRWVTRRWRTLPDGTRDYAAYHGKESFRSLAPVSSHLHTHALPELLARAEVPQSAPVDPLPEAAVVVSPEAR